MDISSIIFLSFGFTKYDIDYPVYLFSRGNWHSSTHICRFSNSDIISIEEVKHYLKKNHFRQRIMGCWVTSEAIQHIPYVRLFCQSKYVSHLLIEIGMLGVKPGEILCTKLGKLIDKIVL